MWRLAKMSMLLTGGFFIGQIAILSAGRAAYSDPFAPYAAIMPGQPSSNLEQYACKPSNDEETTALCSFTLKDGRFDAASVLYDHVIKRVGFHARRGGLTMGDLMQCWGKPNSVRPDFSASSVGLLNVGWGKQHYAVIDAAHHGARLSDYFLPIYAVSIETPSQPCRSG